jgi:hypothetical protein
MKIVEQIYEIIHKPMESASSSSNLPKVHKQLELFLMNNLDKTVVEFEKLSERYKSKYTKFSTLE